MAVERRRVDDLGKQRPVGADQEHARLAEVMGLLVLDRGRDIEPPLAGLFLGQPVADGQAADAPVLLRPFSPFPGVHADGDDAAATFLEPGHLVVQVQQVELAARAVIAAVELDEGEPFGFLLGKIPGAAADGGDPGINRLLNQNLGLGTSANPLADTWMQSVLAAVGNYEEAYTESFCTFDDSGDCLIDRAGSQNAPYWEGGLQYSPPMR